MKRNDKETAFFIARESVDDNLIGVTFDLLFSIKKRFSKLDAIKEARSRCMDEAHKLQKKYNKVRWAQTFDSFIIFVNEEEYTAFTVVQDGVI